MGLLVSLLSGIVGISNYIAWLLLVGPNATYSVVIGSRSIPDIGILFQIILWTIFFIDKHIFPIFRSESWLGNCSLKHTLDQRSTTHSQT
uniref:Putative secreted peptide n=1 Tax=Anopheles braziliensis TaxID=58242 RepID=A0A2M3ZWU3_9DIPT